MHGKWRQWMGMAVALALVTTGCKKNNNTSSEVTIEECAPVTFSGMATEEFIVIMQTDETLRRSSGTLELARRSGNILQRCSVDTTQVRALFNGVEPGFVARLTNAQAALLRKDAEVQLVERDRVISLNTGCFAVVAPTTAQWGVRRTGVGDGTGKKVWIIDTGIDLDHPDLNVDATLSRSFVANVTYADDGNGHGTHVAGIIGALNDTKGVLGVASGATLVALKALDNEGEGNTSNLIRALNYVSQNGQSGDVINMSLGSDTISASLDNAVRTLAERGFLFAIAAGNDAQKAVNTSPARVNHQNVFTVSAIDSLGRFASFSNFGNDAVDVAAPGVAIVSTYSNGRYARLNGTSMAAPHVAGILLLRGTVRTSGIALNDPDGVPDGIAVY